MIALTALLPVGIGLASSDERIESPSNRLTDLLEIAVRQRLVDLCATVPRLPEEKAHDRVESDSSPPLSNEITFTPPSLHDDAESVKLLRCECPRRRSSYSAPMQY